MDSGLVRRSFCMERFETKLKQPVYGHLGDKPNERQTTGRQSNWATAKWATHFGQLGDNIGRVIKDVM